MSIIAYVYDKIGGNAPEDQTPPILRWLYDSAFLAGWYLVAAYATIYSFAAGINERKSSAR
jgi:hypothetical protein